jgi:hypothetical protein
LYIKNIALWKQATYCKYVNDYRYNTQ